VTFPEPGSEIGITDNPSVAAGQERRTVRILQVIQELGTGGAESIVRRMIDAAVETGDDTAVACAGDPQLPAGVELFPLPILRRRPSRVPLASRRLHRAIDAFKPDIVHCHNPGMAVVTALATRRGRIVPAAVTVHGMPPSDERHAARLLRIAGLPVVACGPGVAESLASQRLDVLCTIANGVGPPPPPADRDTTYACWKLAASLRLVVAVGRLAPQKRHDLAVHAVARIPDVALVVLGEGPLRRNLEGLVLDLGVADRVRFPGEHPNPRTLLGVADAVVHPSDWEGMPLAVVEAMSMARPIVATAAPGTRELLRDGVDGLLVPVGDATALSEALRRVLEDRDLARRLGSAAADRWASDFDDRAMLDGYRSLWSELASRGAVQPS
jgi:glycosyltransferase involved in cell wall biosynthesis